MSKYVGMIPGDNWFIKCDPNDESKVDYYYEVVCWALTEEGKLEPFFVFGNVPTSISKAQAVLEDGMKLSVVPRLPNRSDPAYKKMDVSRRRGMEVVVYQ